MRYLLGQASETETQELEERYFADDEFFEHLQTVEDELIDSYVRGLLLPVERQHFEQTFLADPKRRDRVAFARSLLNTADRAPKLAVASPATIKHWWWSGWRNLAQFPVAAMAAILVVAVGISWFVIQDRRLHTQLAQALTQQAALQDTEQALRRDIEQQRTNAQQLAGQLEQERAERSRLEQTAAQRAIIASFILSPGSVRSGTTSPLLIRRGSDTDLVQLELELQGETYPQYRVELRTADDARVWGQDGLQAHSNTTGKAITASLPAGLFAQGNYVLTLNGIKANGDVEEAGQYVFRIIRR